MARWRRRTPEPDPERTAALREAETKIRLVEYMFRASDVRSIAYGDHGGEEAMRKLISEHPDWELAEKATFYLDAAAKQREEALRG